MEDPNERLTTRVSDGELERRWNATREMMQEHKIDYLVMRNSEMFLGGYVQWFTAICARHEFPYTVIFPIDEEMTTINCGGDPPSEQFPPPWAARGIKDRLGAPYFPSIHYTNTYDAELVVGVLKKKQKPTVGWVGKGLIPSTFTEYIEKHLAGGNFLDATEQVDQIKVIKSPEEIGLIKGTAALQDATIEHVKKTIRPGMRDFEVYAEAHYACTIAGTERGLVLCGSGPPGTPVPFQSRPFQNRVIKEGDQVCLLIETNGPGGFYTEIMRIFSIGKEPTQELKDALAVGVEAQELTVKKLEPGADPKDLWDANNAFLEKHGYAPNTRLYAHGQGYDLVERPLIRINEPWKLRAGMNITVHPFVVNQKVWAMVCDNYMVEETGMSERLHKYPREIIVVT
jgi:Xaa-Pro aminopeptidase